MKALILGMVLLEFVFVAGAQTKAVPCYSGQTFPSCTQLERLAKAKMLAKAKTAAITIKATQTIACGDGSDGNCLRTDSEAETVIKRAVDESELWQNLTRSEPKKADVVLSFTTRNRSSLELCAYDADTYNLLWCETRSPSIALDNDAFRELAHFLDALRASQK